MPDGPLPADTAARDMAACAAPPDRLQPPGTSRPVFKPLSLDLSMPPAGGGVSAPPPPPAPPGLAPLEAPNDASARLNAVGKMLMSGALGASQGGGARKAKEGPSARLSPSGGLGGHHRASTAALAVASGSRLVVSMTQLPPEEPPAAGGDIYDDLCISSPEEGALRPVLDEELGGWGGRRVAAARGKPDEVIRQAMALLAAGGSLDGDEEGWVQDLCGANTTAILLNVAT